MNNPQQLQHLMKRFPTPRHHQISMVKTMHTGFLLSFALVLSQALSQAVPGGPEPCCGPITPAGHHLGQTLDSMNVESLWLDGRHINWETGEPDRPADYSGPDTHGHCSAFAASAAKRLGAYLLRPPEHGQELLANAQADWLKSPAATQAGWQPVIDLTQAQRLANRGKLVLVVYQNPDSHVPGHIAIIRPSEKSDQLLKDNGPEIIQAGEQNYNRTNIRRGFAGHPGAWPNGVRYYFHPLP